MAPAAPPGKPSVLFAGRIPTPPGSIEGHTRCPTCCRQVWLGPNVFSPGLARERRRRHGRRCTTARRCLAAGNVWRRGDTCDHNPFLRVCGAGGALLVIYICIQIESDLIHKINDQARKRERATRRVDPCLFSGGACCRASAAEETKASYPPRRRETSASVQEQDHPDC